MLGANMKIFSPCFPPPGECAKRAPTILTRDTDLEKTDGSLLITMICSAAVRPAQMLTFLLWAPNLEEAVRAQSKP